MERLDKLPALKERAYERIKDLILSGHYGQGDALSLREVASQLGTSKTPVREALLRLEQEGLVESVPYRGTYVRPISKREISQLSLVREVLEALATRLATASIPDEDLKRFQSRLDSVQKDMETGDFDSHVESDIALHKLILRNCGNEILQHYVELLAARTYRIRIFSKTESGEHLMQSHLEHCQILAALMERDASKAERLMAEHISNAATRISSYLPADEPTSNDPFCT